MDIAALEAAGLYEPTAANAAERLELLEYLAERGATIDEMLAAQGLGGLPVLAGELSRRAGETWLTSREVSERASVPLDVVDRVARAAGLPTYDPDQPAYRESDIDTFRIFKASVAIIGESGSLEFTRALGAALASIADAAMSTFGINVAAPLHQANVTELERAQAVEAASTMLVGQVPTVIHSLFFHHVQAATRRELAAGGTFSNTNVIDLAVGFLDLVDSTSMVHRLTSERLRVAIGEFERHATELIGARGGRVVKTIGDAVMFVVPDPAAACDAALELRAFVAAHDVLTQLRGGLACGRLARGYGDFYGPEVNLASRLVNLADPGTLLVSEALRDRVVPTESHHFEGVGPSSVLGFDDPVQAYRVERTTS